MDLLSLFFIIHSLFLLAEVVLNSGELHQTLPRLDRAPEAVPQSYLEGSGGGTQTAQGREGEGGREAGCE